MLEGLGIGIVLAIVLSGISVISDSFAAVYNMVVSMFDLIPGIALISAIIIFLYGQNDIAIVIWWFIQLCGLCHVVLLMALMLCQNYIWKLTKYRFVTNKTFVWSFHSGGNAKNFLRHKSWLGESLERAY